MSNPTSEKQIPETINRFRFDILRKGATTSLQCMTSVLRQLEDGHWMDETDTYHETMKAVGILAKALQEATEP